MDVTATPLQAMERSSPSNTLEQKTFPAFWNAFSILPFHLVQRTILLNMLLFIICALGVKFKDSFSVCTLLLIESVSIYRWQWDQLLFLALCANSSSQEMFSCTTS